jgi:hypothetical protein
VSKFSEALLLQLMPRPVRRIGLVPTIVKLGPKQLEVLRELVPTAPIIALLVNPD